MKNETLLHAFSAILLSICCFSSPCHSQEYYVSITGDDGNPGTLVSPWRTIQFAVDNAGPGDTIFVRGGTYGEQVLIYDADDSGSSAGGCVTLQHFDGEIPRHRRHRHRTCGPRRADLHHRCRLCQGDRL